RGDWHWGSNAEFWTGTEEAGIRTLDPDGELGAFLPQPDGRWGFPQDRLPDGRYLARLTPPQDGRRLGVWDPESGELTVPDAQADLPG
ncbi:MAG: hypothetical protein GWN85_14110, partial [Gemmatimonadetes bacterium]|nr:hypothetical protein [Gemmatimonadota bacterium]NIR36850.1 hypothetical protein [Actinomycetota bacterium]